CDRADGLSLFDLTSGASPAPPATADSTVRSQWATRDAAARLAVRRHLPTTERAHFSQYRSAQTLYDAVVARYSSPATAALSRLFLPYLFPDLTAFPTATDLITHLRTSDTRYRAALPAEGVPLPPSYPLLPLLLRPTSVVSSRSALCLPLAGDAAPTRARGAGVPVGLAGAVEVVVVEAVEGAGEAVEGAGVVVGVVAGVEVSVAAVEAAGAEAEAAEVVVEVVEAAVALVAALRRGVVQVVVRARSSSAVATPLPPSSFVTGTLVVSGVGVLVPAPTAGVAIFDLDYDAILAAMYALSTSDEGDCYLCLPPDPGGGAAALGACEAAALGASASAAPGAGESALSGTESAQVFHTFTLDSGASRSFFRDRTTLTPLSRSVAVSLADPSGGGADLQDQGVDQFTPASQRVTHCTCARTGRHLATFTRRPGSSLYTLSTASPPVPPSGQVAASSQVLATTSGPGPESAPCSCRLAPPPRSPLPASSSRHGLPCPCLWSPQVPTSPPFGAYPYQRPLRRGAAARCPSLLRGHERYFLLVVDDYSRYTTVFPLRSKGDVTEVLIDWIRAARLQLRESFGSDFPVLRLHSDRGGEFSSARLGAFCRARGIRQTFTIPASPQQNGIAERRIGMVMDVARTSMIHAAAPHFLWPFAVQYAAHQLNLQPRVSVPETSPTLRWTGKVGNASVFRVWGSRAFVPDLSADKLSPRAVP
ncbi:unnamed protein product, partial [Closterium sp. NIES-53]